MRRLLPWLILLFPAAELWVLIQVGEQIGALATVGLVIAAVFVGFAILRLRGIHIAKSMQAELTAGRIPSNQIADTFCLMLAGVLFIFPGFVSDGLAILLIIPAFRTLALSLASHKMKTQGFHAQTTHFSSSTDGPGPATWTCTTYGPQPDENHNRHALRGNAVVIDCEPESASQPDSTAREEITFDVDSGNQRSPR